MEDSTKGLLDALHDQIQRRDDAKHETETARSTIERLMPELHSKVSGPKDAWVAAFTELLDEGDYVSAVKLAVVAHDQNPLSDAWRWPIREEMARRLLDESRNH